MVVVSGGILRHGDQENSSLWPHLQIDSGSRRDSDLGGDLAATMVVRSGIARLQKRRVQELRAVIGVECIQAVVLRRDVQNVVRTHIRESQSGDIERLGVYLAIHGEREQSAER